jgi:peptidylprolyl isomerase
MYAKLDTNKGEIVIKLEYEKTPLTVINFAGLIEGKKKSNKDTGVPFYDGLKFHRVIKDFMVQGGDPLGSGMGGPGYKFDDEITDLKHSESGILSMANSGPNSNGSQFFITHVATPWLDGKHTVFGSVVNGIEVVNLIEKDDYIIKATIVRVGEKASSFRTDEDAFQQQIERYSDIGAAIKKENTVKLANFIDTNYTNAIEHSEGLYSQIELHGDGDTPKYGDTVNIILSVDMGDGTTLMEKGEPIKIEAGKLQIEVLNNSILSMKSGEKRTLIAPYYVISDDIEIQGLSPTSSAIILFNIELISIKPAE